MVITGLGADVAARRPPVAPRWYIRLVYTNIKSFHSALRFSLSLFQFLILRLGYHNWFYSAKAFHVHSCIVAWQSFN
jgi:hypothetical protein